MAKPKLLETIANNATKAKDNTAYVFDVTIPASEWADDLTWSRVGEVPQEILSCTIRNDMDFIALPFGANAATFYDCGIRLIGFGLVNLPRHNITFKCDVKPETDITVHILVRNVIKV